MSLSPLNFDRFLPPMVWVNAEGGILAVTPAASEMFCQMREWDGWSYDPAEVDPKLKPLVIAIQDFLKVEHVEEERFLREIAFSDGIRAYDILLQPLDVSLHSTSVVLTVTFFDVTPRQAGRAELQESESKFHTMANAVHDAVIMVDLIWGVTYWNQAAERMFGYLAMETDGKALHELIVSPSDREKYAEWFAVWCRERKEGGTTSEWTACRKDGTEIAVELSLSAVLLSGRWSVIAIIRDVTLRKAAENAVRTNERRLSSIMDAFADPCYVCNAEHRIEYANSAMIQAFGNVVGRLSNEVVFGEDQMQQCCYLDDTKRENGVHYEAHHPNNGRLYSVKSAPMMNDDSSVSSIYVLRDVTDERERQTQTALSHKMEAIGQLASGIAHEINTPTQFISDSVLFVQENWPTISKVLSDYLEAQKGKSVQEDQLTYIFQEVPRALEDAKEGLQRIISIVRAMREFAHHSDEKTNVDLNHSIETTITVARNEWKYFADIEKIFDPNLPPVPCYSSDLNEVVLNLIVNAAQAISEKQAGTGKKGVIRVTTSCQEGFARIEIEDDGPGIPEKIRTRIFDPFFTTKALGKGTGQGLYISHQVIVKKHGGRIGVTSKEGEGTVFCVEIPMKDSS